MEASSTHRRDSSLSSSGSNRSVDSNGFVEDFTGANPESASKCPPLRARLGAEMAILAATSPEIKALNLPFTSNFPEGMTGHHRCHSSDYSSLAAHSSASSSTNSSFHPTGRLTPLLDAMKDDMQEADTKLDSESLQIWLNGAEDNLTRSFRGCSLDESIRRELVSDDVSDKENVHPNLMHKHASASNNPMNASGSIRRTNGSLFPTLSKPRPSKPIRRRPTLQRPTSLHRRVSYDSLPSPAEIDASSRVLRRGESCRHFTFEPSEKEKSDNRRRIDPLAISRPKPKSLQLMTGFR